MYLIEKYFIITLILIYWLVLIYLFLQVLREVPYFMWKITLELIQPQTPDLINIIRG